MTYRRRPRQAPKPALSAAMTGVGLAITILVFAVELLHIFEPADPAEPLQRLLGLVVVLLLIQSLAAGFQILAFLVAVLGRNLARLSKTRWRNYFASLPVTCGLFVLAAPRLINLFSGPWIMDQSWRPIVLVLLLLSTAFLLAKLGARAAAAYLAQGRIPTKYVVLAAATAPVLFLVDAHESLARKYLAAHDLLALAGLVLTVIAGSRFTRLKWRQFGATQLVLGLLAALSVAFGLIPGESVQLREVLLGRSRVLGRLLSEILPPADESNTAVDLDFLRALQQRTEVDPNLIDQALPGRSDMDVVLITLDTLRFDACSALGGREGDTPTLDRFLSESQVFPRAWTQFPSSRFALNSLLTGRYPTTTSLYDSGRLDTNMALADNDVSLAEELGRVGFRREAVTSFPADFMAREAAHMQRGFDRFNNLEGNPLDLSERVVDLATDLLNEPRPAEQRLLLWCHLFDLHRPYRPRDGLSSRAPAIDRYRAELRHVDACLQRLFESIDFERTIVILHSDHGEEFEEHGGVGHHSSLYEEQIRVPMALRIPGSAGRRWSDPAELVDLRPTILELVGAAPDDDSQGQSLAGMILELESAPKPTASAFAQFREPRFVHGNLDALVVGDIKIIHDRKTGLFELYDLQADLAETLNLASKRSELLGAMRSKLAAMRTYLGLRVDPARDFGGMRLIKNIVAETNPRSSDLDALVERLRDPTPLEHGALDLLLDHQDARLRRMAVLRIATHPDTGAMFTLRDWANSGDREQQLEAALGLALLGNDGFREDLKFLEPDFDGELRLLGMLARYAGGETELADSLHQILADPNNDRDLDSLGFAVLGRMGDPRGLITFYQRLILGLSYSEQLLLVQESTAAFSFAKKAPLLRLFLRHRDRALRAGVEDWLQRFPERQDWAIVARKAEVLATQARDLGVSAASFEQAAANYAMALALMAEVGHLDWGLLLEMSFLYNVCGHRAELAAAIEALLEKVPTADDWARGLALRLIGLSRFSERPVRGEIEAITEDGPRPGESGRVILLVRLRLFEDSAGVVGGMGPETEYLAAATLNAFDQPQGEPSVLPLPVTTILPGETVILAVPVEIGLEQSSAPRVGVRLGRADIELAPAIVIESLR